MTDVAPLTHPLEGLSLIEASAGTGKTTTLVRLYLRALLLEKRQVQNILAVTYTRAATGELSLRIRKALIEAREMLCDPPLPHKSDSGDFLRKLFEKAGGDSDLLLKCVDAAIATLDDKAVFTIHGFCQRMLADNAFEAGAAFASTPSEDEGALQAEAAADFWRQRSGDDRSENYVRWLVATLGSPANLLEKIRDPLMVGASPDVQPKTELADVKAAETEFDKAAAAAKKAWNKDRDVLDSWIRSSNDLNRGVYRKETTPRLLDEWEAWIADSPCPVLPVNFVRLTLEMAQSSLKKGVEKNAVPDKPFFKRRLGDALQKAADRLRTLWWQETYAAACDFVRDETRRRKRETRALGFDDMLRNLRDALKAQGGKGLAQRIAGQYPLILVDEFQDTDPLQSEIFTRIHDADPKHGLILIGDPKQAIYRFRGADIFTYLEMRERCEKSGQIYSLSKNFRSTVNLLEALNKLFGKAKDAFVYAGIPYVDVEPGREITALAGASDSAMTVVFPAVTTNENGTATKDEASRVAAETCSKEISRLLIEGAAGRLRCDDEAVQAKDIAVLVGTNRQGAMVQDALRRRGIMAAMVSTESVFESAEAEVMETVLAAVAEPANGGLLRRALVTPLLGATAADLEAWTNEESRWDEIVSAFRGYRDCWQERGFAVMFARLLAEQNGIRHTLARPDGERAMTNLRHLAELAGEEASRHPGIEPLLAWFAAERNDVLKADARQLRLESDADLVHIATVHRAKGLQYPIVFLPFLWYVKDNKNAKENPAVLAHDGYEMVLDLGSDDLEARKEQAEREWRAEEVRKTYVALTRAERACYIIAVPANKHEESAFAGLLNVNDAQTLGTALKKWSEGVPEAVTVRAPIKASPMNRDANARVRGEARPFTHEERLRQRFHVASYSLLAAGASGGAIEAPERDETVAAIPAAETATGIHKFPAGAASGTFLHEVIEALDFDADETTIHAEVQKRLAANGFEPHWEKTLTPWLAELFRTPLGEPACSLAEIPRTRRRDELEFHFLMNPIQATRLNNEVLVFAPVVPRPDLHFDDVAGQMKGYLDLVFEHAGRFWVADYKSNRLGSDLAAYTPEALDRAMAEHRYDLQYLIYTVALHRYLKTRIPDYDYEKHFGGVLYLFLRGMAPDAPAPRGVWHTRPARADIERLDAYLAWSKP